MTSLIDSIPEDASVISALGSNQEALFDTMVGLGALDQYKALTYQTIMRSVIQTGNVALASKVLYMILFSPNAPAVIDPRILAHYCGAIGLKEMQDWGKAIFPQVLPDGTFDAVPVPADPAVLQSRWFFYGHLRASRLPQARQFIAYLVALRPEHQGLLLEFGEYMAEVLMHLNNTELSNPDYLTVVREFVASGVDYLPERLERILRLVVEQNLDAHVGEPRNLWSTTFKAACISLNTPVCFRLIANARMRSFLHEADTAMLLNNVHDDRKIFSFMALDAALWAGLYDVAAELVRQIAEARLVTVLKAFVHDVMYRLQIYKPPLQLMESMISLLRGISPEYNVREFIAVAAEFGRHDICKYLLSVSADYAGDMNDPPNWIDTALVASRHSGAIHSHVLVASRHPGQHQAAYIANFRRLIRQSYVHNVSDFSISAAHSIGAYIHGSE